MPVNRKNFSNLTGLKFGKLNVIEFAGKDAMGSSFWKCQCECGKVKLISVGDLKSGNSSSCGCGKARIGDRTRKHGRTESREYYTWCSMKSRCFNPKNKKFHRYGARGITVCERWRNSFENFFFDMGKKPEGMSIERKDNNENYEPLNCRWATPKEQASNTRRNIFVEHEGKKITVSELERRMGFEPEFISVRLRSGWTFERAISQPKRHCNRPQ